MAACSPTKWHRGHTAWFFEEFILAPQGVPHGNAIYKYWFNLYYDAIGPRHPQARRGLLSRPSAAEVAAYRRTVDGRMVELLAAADPVALEALDPLVRLGIAHEEHHQELMLTDILHAFW
jgi:hypothetical protein